MDYTEPSLRQHVNHSVVVLVRNRVRCPISKPIMPTWPGQLREPGEVNAPTSLCPLLRSASGRRSSRDSTRTNFQLTFLPVIFGKINEGFPVSRFATSYITSNSITGNRTIVNLLAVTSASRKSVKQDNRLVVRNARDYFLSSSHGFGRYSVCIGRRGDRQKPADCISTPPRRRSHIQDTNNE